jgi:hypothetical protein
MPKSLAKVNVHRENSNKADQSAETLFFFRLQGVENKFSPMKLGVCPSIDSFFGKIANHVHVPAQSILQVAIRFPTDIGRLKKHVLQIEAGNQPEFDTLVKIIANAVVELDSSTVPTRYILTATIAVK